ncbi:MAG TPA: response regulator [Clostridiales bacterium]|nr:response regulator [Clostridiales bacterium]
MYTYILIDDEAITRKGTLKKLEPIRETVSCIAEAENGEAALELMKEHDPDIIITDMQMPVMNGTQLLPYLSEHYPEKQIIVISGFKDFDYIKHAITANAVDYILKPFSSEDIQKAVANAIKKLESKEAIQNQIVSSEEEKEAAHYEYDIQMLKNLILGYHKKAPVLTSKKLNYINNTHNILLTVLHTARPMEEKDIVSFLEEGSFQDMTLYMPHLNNERLGIIILFIPERSPITSRRLCLQLVEDITPIIEQKENNRATFGISLLHSDLMELHDAYQEASHALNCRKIAEHSSSHYFYEKTVAPLFLEWSRTDEFLFRLEAGMAREVDSLVDQLFHFYETVPGCTLNDVKYHCYQLTEQVRTMMNYYLEQSNTANETSSMQNIVNYIFELEQVKEYYRQFFLNIAELLRAKSIYAVDDVIERIQIYLQHNYQRDLSVEFVSSLFYMNRSYCSHLFRVRTGQKFVDYLNQIRIDKAKELLVHTDKKMYHIAKAVGYDNAKYFFRVFKKLTGSTPERYREKQEIKQE